jgi:hypothetical protein
MTNKNKMLLIGVITVCLVGVIFILSDKQSTVLETDNSEQITGAGEEIDTSTWKTYKNAEFGFKFKHPVNLSVYSAEESEDKLPRGSVFINLPTKYPYAEKIDLSNLSTYANYQVSIIPRGNGTQNESIEEIISNLSALAEEQLKIVRVNGNTAIISDDEKRFFYFVGEKNTYSLNTEGLIPMPNREEGDDWSLDYNESEIKEWNNSYIDYTNFVLGVAETFEFIE